MICFFKELNQYKRNCIVQHLDICAIYMDVISFSQVSKIRVSNFLKIYLIGILLGIYRISRAEMKRNKKTNKKKKLTQMKCHSQNETRKMHYAYWQEQIDSKIQVNLLELVKDKTFQQIACGMNKFVKFLRNDYFHKIRII